MRGRPAAVFGEGEPISLLFRSRCAIRVPCYLGMLRLPQGELRRPIQPISAMRFNDPTQRRSAMKIFSYVLLAGMVLLNQPSLAQTAQPLSPDAPSVPGANSAPGGPASGTAAAPNPRRQIPVSALTDKDLKGQNGADLGDIKRVIESKAEKKSYLVVSRGGLLGFFDQEYLVPLDQIAIAGDRVIAKNMTPAQLENSTKFVDDAATYQPLENTQLVSIPEQR
jgi:sporulation protein YlmC with PRC-barrel domain